MKNITKYYITIDDAVEKCKRPGCLIPGEFLSTFPNSFGINLCAIKGFEVEMTNDNQYYSLKVDFLPVDQKVGIDGRETID